MKNHLDGQVAEFLRQCEHIYIVDPVRVAKVDKKHVHKFIPLSDNFAAVPTIIKLKRISCDLITDRSLGFYKA